MLLSKCTVITMLVLIASLLVSKYWYRQTEESCGSMHTVLIMLSFLMIFLVVMACKHVKVISNSIMNKLIFGHSNNIDDTGQN